MSIKGLNTTKGRRDVEVVGVTPGNVDAGVRELDRTRTGMKEGWYGRDDICSSVLTLRESSYC